MSTSLTAYVKGGNLPSLDRDAMAQALSQASAEERSGSAGEGVEYVSFSGKTGAITYGRDRDDLDQSEVFLMEPRSAFTGWICWKDNKPVARHEWSIYQKQLAVAEEDLEDKGPYTRKQDGWQTLLGFGFISTESDEAVQYSFSTNSVSGKNSVTDLFDEIAKRTINGEPNFPLFRFTKERFHAQGEWNWKPKFDIDEWLTEAEAAEILGSEADADAAEVVRSGAEADAKAEAEAEIEAVVVTEPEPEAKPQRRTRTRRT